MAIFIETLFLISMQYSYASKKVWKCCGILFVLKKILEVSKIAVRSGKIILRQKIAKSTLNSRKTAMNSKSKNRCKNEKMKKIPS